MKFSWQTSPMLNSLNRSSLSSVTGRTAVETIYNPTHPLTTDETTSGVCQPQEWRKPGIHQQMSQIGPQRSS